MHYPEATRSPSFIRHRGAKNRPHNSKHLSRTQGSEKATARPDPSVCPSYQPHRHKTTSFLPPIPCWLLATTTSSEEGRDFLVLPFSNFSAWFRLSGCPAHQPWRAHAMLRAKLCRGQATTLGNRCAKVSSLVPIPQGRRRRIFNPKHFNSLRIINRVCRNNRNINWVGLKSKKCLNKS